MSAIRIFAGALRAAASVTALLAFAAPALAADYTATDNTTFRNDIGTANGDGDPSSTITLGNDVTLTSTVLPLATKDLTIDSGSFTFLKAYSSGTTNQGVVAFGGTSAGTTITLKGTVTGISGGGNNNGQYALDVTAGAVVANYATLIGGEGSGTGAGGGALILQTSGNLTNNGIATAGNSAGGTGGGGAFMVSGASLTNNSTLTGGNGVNGGYGVSMTLSASTVMNNGTITAGNGTTGAGGVGATVQAGSTFTNKGILVAGNGATGGVGVNLGGPNGTTTSTLINSGTITGGDGSTTPGGGIGVDVHIGAGTIVNSGTIQGGAGAVAIQNVVVGVNLAPVSIINSGTISAGSGQASAIVIPNASPLTLELDRGSVIHGNVVGGTGTNTLILGGDDNASFDVSTVGPQYQNFTAYQKTGNSIWSLTGTGTASTPWVISQGTLQVGDGTATGSFIGDVTDNATLAFNRPDTITFANVITGTGGVNQVGGGKTILTAASTYSGPTLVSAGTLSVNGSITSAVTVQSGGTLGGSGTVGATTIQSGGTIAPGNSIGTLHINGAFVQAAGSTYQVEADPGSSNADLIAVNGAATLQSGAGLNVTQNPSGLYQVGTVYKVLTASGGVTGTYALSGQTSNASAFLALKDSYDANNVYLTVVQTRDLDSAATTPNQTAVSQDLDALSSSNPLTTAALNSPSDAAARAAFDALSGDAVATTNSMLVSGSVLVRDATFDRLRDVSCATPDDATDNNVAGCVAAGDRPTLWGQGFGDWDHINSNGNAAGIAQTTAGFLVGMDVPVLGWRVGVFAGHSHSDFDSAARTSQGTADSNHLGGYAGTAWNDFDLRLGAAYSWNDLATERLVAFSGFSNDLRASYNAGTTQLFGELGEKFALDSFLLEPFANIAYVNLRTGGFSETGGAAALTSRDSVMDDAFTTFGVRPSTEIALGDLDLVAQGMIGWRHTFGAVTPSTVVSFSGSNAFTVDGAPIARDAGVIEIGAHLAVSDKATVGLTYGGQFSTRETDNSLRGTFAVTF